MSYSRLNLLFSQTYLQTDGPMLEITLGLSDLTDILIDSGAHSNYHIWRQRLNGKKPSNKPVDLASYIKACKSLYDGRVWEYIMLDVVKDPAQSDANLQEMLRHGLTPMPVMVIGDPISRASRLKKTNRRVAVAGGVNYGGKHHIHERFQEINDQAGVAIHALGYGRYPDTLTLPIASADASSWCSGQQYGYINRYDYRTGFSRIRWIDLKPDSSLSPSKRREWLRYMIHDLRMTREMILDPATYRGPSGLPNLTTVHAYIRFAHQCSQQGVRFFMAVPSGGWMRPIIAVLASLSADGASFDYPDARSWMDWLTRDLKRDTGAFIDSARQVLLARTDWRNPLP